ncbi:NUDIX domain-containing protein [Azoarcus sp. KH32C]|uniref:NUDIX domain-containing protein n=1 Tax=Azoarcus sp. KH32C TaxID=748247 RepID=UPI00023865DE|nr:NUDIX hydrolase [Azoarcus sp. KH32C]BAL23664.1 hypothetical protein AZKH_1342 [Azoarcus sp. KH32C]
MSAFSSPIPHAKSYGGILLTRTGKVLLREPANHWDGYVWTFAKGTSDPGESPVETALREVREETGYPVEIVGILPGVFHSGWGSSVYFVMRHSGEQGRTHWETRSTRWADFDTAASLISKSTNVKGRARDLAVLDAAKAWFDANDTGLLPSSEGAKKLDWKTVDMPAQHVTLQLDFTLTADEAAQVRLGYIPAEMEEKWFAYFDDNTLYQHRSWTGFCIDQVHFVPDGAGLRATHAKVNRDREQYGNTNDAEDVARIESLVRRLARGQ